MNKRLRRKQALARRRTREYEATRTEARRDGAVIVAVGSGGASPGGRHQARTLRGAPVPRTVDDFYLAADGPRLVTYGTEARVVVSDPIAGRVVRWFDLKRLARGVGVDPRAGMVVFGYGDKRLLGSRWDRVDGVVHLDPAAFMPRRFFCDREADRIHAVDEHGVLSWRYRDGKALGQVAWDLPQLPEYHGWVFLEATAVPGTRTVAALMAHEEAYAERQPYLELRIVFTGARDGHHRASTDIVLPGSFGGQGLVGLPAGVPVAAGSQGLLARVFRPEALDGAALALTASVLKLGWVAGRPVLAGMGAAVGAGQAGGCYLVDPASGRPWTEAELPPAWRGAPALPRRDQRGRLSMGAAPPRIVAGRTRAVLAEDTGASARLTLLGPEGARALFEQEDTGLGGIAIDDEAGEVVASLLPRARGSSPEVARWGLRDGDRRPARSQLSCWRGIRGFAPDGGRVYGMDEDRGTLRVAEGRTGELLVEVPGRRGGVQPDFARRLWANPGGDTVFMAWRSEGESYEYTTRRILFPEGEVRELPGHNLGPVAFQPGGRVAALVWRYTEVALWEREAPAPVPTGMDLEGRSVAGLDWSPDGRFLVVAPAYGDGLQAEPELWLWDVREQAVVGQVPVAGGVPKALAFSGDGRWLYLLLAGGEAVVWEAEVVLEEARRR